MISNNDRDSQNSPSQRSLSVEGLEDRNLYAADIIDSLDDAQSNSTAQPPMAAAEISGAANVDHRQSTGDVDTGPPISPITDPPIDMEKDVSTMLHTSAMTGGYYVEGPHNDPNLPVTDEILIRGYATTGTVAARAASPVADPPIDMEKDIATMLHTSAMTGGYYVEGPHNDPNLPVTDEILIRGYSTTGTDAATAASPITDPPIDMENDVAPMPHTSAMTSGYYVEGPHNDPNLPVTDEILIRGYAMPSPTDSTSVGSSVVIVRGSEPAVTENSDPRTAVATDVALSQSL